MIQRNARKDERDRNRHIGPAGGGLNHFLGQSLIPSVGTIEAGLGRDGHAADLSLRESPVNWARIAVQAYRAADRIVAE